MLYPDSARISWVYEAGSGGTPPYVTSLDFINDDAVDDGDAGVLLSGCETAWNTHITQFISATLGGGHVDVVYQRSTDVFEGSVPIDDGDDAADSLETMGFSFRVVKNGARPTGGRRGAMYIMGARGDSFNGNGTITSTGIQTALDDFFTDLVAISGWHPITVHKIDEVESITTVLSLSLAPTISFLRRRYR